ncbi:ABC transporter substrate-binding protein [Brucella pituitosa]|uniref:NrtA/SsuA/CpmA family ABC transporter substrate-binding protein n=1 Tax=Brucella pituitosa TaxID=571256 RepID=A0ABS3K2P9_9HYPH|nr:NrtA/SsuA/CpmA family ABC transporter substrate-binding protein [Brucella pituitosa]MBO1041172.1 NrtA/SsuA/CpmA family ABC transporter substrate-binding protein [Brucella pituitosa]
MTSFLNRRQVLVGAALSALSAPTVLRAQDTQIIRVGALKLIHSIGPYFYEQFTPAGYKVEVYPFESPTEGKNAVVTKSVDFGMFGVAAALLGAAAGEPISVIAGACNKGMAIIAGKDTPISSVKDLKGKKVAIWPGSTQEVFLLERLRMEGLSIKDITPVRVSFSEMHLALARGDIDAYSGAEPGPGVSLATGVGKLVEYPYSTSMGGLNMVFGAHHDTPASNPELTKIMLDIHRKAVDYATANPKELAAMAVTRLGQKPDAIELSVPNVELTWKFGPTQIEQTKTYAQHMLELKQIRRLPDFDAFFQTSRIQEMESSL